MNSWMLFVCPKPGIMSVQNSSNKARNCDNEVQNKTDNKLAWELWPTFPLILTAFSSTIKEVAEIPFKGKTTTAKYTYSSVTTQTGSLGRRLSNPKDFWKQKILKFFLFFCKWSNKIQDSTRESFVLEIVVIGQSSSKCPGSSSCTVIDIFSSVQFSSVYWFATFEGCTKTRSSKYLKANGEEA